MKSIVLYGNKRKRNALFHGRKVLKKYYLENNFEDNIKDAGRKINIYRL